MHGSYGFLNHFKSFQHPQPLSSKRLRAIQPSNQKMLTNCLLAGIRGNASRKNPVLATASIRRQLPTSIAPETALVS